MSFRQFTWWRRFYAPLKLQPKHLSKVRSELLQRIEFGEFEYDPLGEQSRLEPIIFEQQVAEYEAKSERLSRDTKYDHIAYLRRQRNKRMDIMMTKHLDQENSTLLALSRALAKEFDMEVENVQAILEDFDGTTRHLYFYLQAMANGRPLPDAEDVQMIPRILPAQPRHMMKENEHKWLPAWLQLVKDRNIWGAL